MLKESRDYIQNIFGKTPVETAIILGSGLGGFVNEIPVINQIDYGDIPHFPVSTVCGHSGKLLLAEINNIPVLIMNGRFHYYEGYSVSELAYPIRTLRLLGVKTLIVTNAVGGINPALNEGDFVLITDHIKFFDDSPLRGKNADEFGERFPDMTNAYSTELIQRIKDISIDIGVPVHEGVYAFMSGPNFETPAEIRALSVLGADVVGMSTVPEVITAVHAGMRVLGISVVTNKAAGLSPNGIKHGNVCETGTSAVCNFKKLIIPLFPL